MTGQATSALLLLGLLFAIGVIWIEFQARRKKSSDHYGPERRRTRKIAELEPLGESILKETQHMLDQERLHTRDGLKFIMRMMSELYVADMRRTLKVNELVEQMEVLRHKSLIAWIEDRPKFSLFMALVILALVVDEFRVPILRFALAKIGVVLP